MSKSIIHKICTQEDRLYRKSEEKTFTDVVQGENMIAKHSQDL